MVGYIVVLGKEAVGKELVVLDKEAVGTVEGKVVVGTVEDKEAVGTVEDIGQTKFVLEQRKDHTLL
jgi:hypothetical protein